MTPVQDPQQVNIPESCSSEQLFKDANEVVELTTNLARLEDQYEQVFTQYYNDPPSPGMTDKALEMWVLLQIQENHSELQTEISTTRARMKGLVFKANILDSASRIAAVENGTSLHV